MFNFPLLLTLEVWVIIQLLLFSASFALTYYFINFLLSELRSKKIEIDEITQIKKSNLLKVGLPIFYICFFLYAFYITDFFYLNQLRWKAEILLYLSCFPALPLGLYFGTQSLHPKLIEPASNIQKVRDIFNLNRLYSALNISQSKPNPLICFFEDGKVKGQSDPDPWLENCSKGSISSEDRGLILGASGSGKSSFLVAQVINWMQSGKSFLITDIKPEIWSILRENGVFERYGYVDWVINPTDVYSHHYNIFSEIRDVGDLNEILAVLIPDSDEATEVFTSNARRLLKAIVFELATDASLPSCRNYLNSCDNAQELIKNLKKSKNQQVQNVIKELALTATNENLLASIMTSMIKAFEVLDDVRVAQTTARSDLAFRKVLLEPKQAIFLQFEQEYKNTTANLFGAMVAHILRILQSNYRERAEVFVGLDEIINCAPIPKFVESLNTMRSAKMPTFLYLQALEGLNRLYGLNAERLFMGACDFKAVFKINDLETAQTMSALLGETEATITSYSTGDSRTSSNKFDGKNTSNSNSKTVQTTLLKIFEPERFKELEVSTAIVIYNKGAGLLKMPCHHEDFPCKKRPTLVNPEQVARAKKAS